MPVLMSVRTISPSSLLTAHPEYATGLGAAYVGDSLELLKQVPSKSISAVVTSPPYALHFKKKYGNPEKNAYVEWFVPFATEFRRILRPRGSLVLEIGGAWNAGEPTRSVYHFELLVRLVRECGFHLAQEFFWYNSAAYPAPAEWVNVRRIRVKPAVTPIWWLSPSPTPVANNRNVLTPYKPDMQRLLRKGYNRGKRPSGHVANKFGTDNGGAIPSNLIQVAHTRSVEGYQAYCRQQGLTTHPARFPGAVPEFFIKFVTRRGGIVLDPFAGSNMTGYVAETLGRRWLAFDKSREYVHGSFGRFVSDPQVSQRIITSLAPLTE